MGRKDDRPRGEILAVSGEFQWPPAGRFSWPPSAEEVGIRAVACDAVLLETRMIGLVERTVWHLARWAGEVANVAPEEIDSLRWFNREEIARINLAHPTDLSILERLLGELPEAGETSG